MKAWPCVPSSISPCPPSPAPSSRPWESRCPARARPVAMCRGAPEGRDGLAGGRSHDPGSSGDARNAQTLRAQAYTQGVAWAGHAFRAQSPCHRHQRHRRGHGARHPVMARSGFEMRRGVPEGRDGWQVVEPRSGPFLARSPRRPPRARVTGTLCSSSAGSIWRRWRSFPVDWRPRSPSCPETGRSHQVFVSYSNDSRPGLDELGTGLYARPWRWPQPARAPDHFDQPSAMRNWWPPRP